MTVFTGHPGCGYDAKAKENRLNYPDITARFIDSDWCLAGAKKKPIARRSHTDTNIGHMNWVVTLVT